MRSCCRSPTLGNGGIQRLFAVIERFHGISDDLFGFVPFAGDNQQVACFERRGGNPDCFRAVADLKGIRACFTDLTADFRRILRARIIIGHNDPVSKPRRNLSHDWAFAFVAITATTEYEMKASGDVRPKRNEYALKCVGLVGIVDIDR